MTFGYINSTFDEIPIDKNLKENNTNSVVKIGDYISEIENNIFAYELIGIKIINLPDPQKCGIAGYFINNKTNEEIKEGDLLSVDAVLRYILVRPIILAQECSIDFAGVVKEPNFDSMNKNSERVDIYPVNNYELERNFYSPKILIGRTIKYSYEINCFDTCDGCYKITNNPNNQQCFKCIENSYFINGTKNCFEYIDGYYFNNKTETFFPCYSSCETCNEKEVNSTYMNCLTCKPNYNFYNKTKNCLNCPNYVNYLQTECIDKIPAGYFLLDKKLGTIEKCHNLCKTCNIGPFLINDTLYMNCQTCLYTNKKYKPINQGDCPSSNEEDYEVPINGQCSREKPILIDNKCKNIFCTKEEFDSGKCKINNNYIKTQWLNKFHIFNDDLSSYLTYDINDKGDLFLLAQKKDNLNINQYLYGFNQNGKGIFYEKEKNKYTSFKSFTYQFPTFIDKIKYIEINNEGYLLSVLNENKIYLIDYNNNNEIYSHSLYYKPFSFDSIIKLKNKENVYFFDFIYCLEETNYDECYIGFINFKIEKKNIFILENSNSEEVVKVNYNTKLTCLENSYNIIQCKYSVNKDEERTVYQQIVTLFNRDTFELIEHFILDEFFIEFQTFDSMIQLKENIFVIAYSIKPNIIQVLFKKLSLDINNNYILDDYLSNIPYININEDLIYDFTSGNSFRNNLFRLNDDEFVMLINDCKNSIQYSYLNTALIIITFHLYNNNQNILLRHYKIDFGLYNMYINGDLMGYNLGGYFGALIELTSPEQQYISMGSFLTFGYINTTDDISYEKGTKYLITNKSNIKVNDYISEIENNLFGYEFVGVKIISLPDENKVGYFINLNNNNNKITLNEIININSVLKFVINKNPIKGNYTLSFAGIVKEPEFQIANNFSNKVEYYPNTSTPEKYLNEQKTLIGKEFKFSFTIEEKIEEKKCYDNCETCIRPSKDINDQDCIKCKNGFYFKDDTKNCYDKIEYQYYFNKQTNTFSPCYKDCYTCDTKEIDSTHMNCLSCHSLYKFYQKSTNCLKCSKYVNYLQTECIDTIPEGYYLSDEIYGTIEKCHRLCKTCKAGPYKQDGKIHMNCEVCLYEDKLSKISIKGNCPEFSRKSNKESNNLGIWIVIILIILASVLIGLIIYMKCFKNQIGIKKIKKTGYLKIEGKGKDIPFEDEDSFAIN